MLPSSGYFKNIQCPYFEQDKCDRVYCFYKHKKSETITSSSTTINYTPTPIHVLKKQKTEQTTTTTTTTEYKPTPIIKLICKEEEKEEEKDKNKEINEEEEEEIIELSDEEIEEEEVEKEVENKLDENVFKSIESKLSSIFAKSEESEKTLVDNNDKNDTPTHYLNKNVKKDDCSYIEELDKISNETKAKRDQQDKEIVASKKSRKEKNIPLVDESDRIANPNKKARVAHKSGDNVSPSINILLPKKSLRISPAQVMFNRFNQIKDKKETTTRTNFTTTNSTTNTATTKIESNKSQLPSSISSSNNKKRIAHIPSSANQSTDSPKRPTLPLELGGKVPNIIRQKYLNLLIDECLKIINDHEEAYEKALNEEQTIYKRSPSKKSYINLAVIAIKRIRDSAKTK